MKHNFEGLSSHPSYKCQLTLSVSCDICISPQPTPTTESWVTLFIRGEAPLPLLNILAALVAQLVKHLPNTQNMSWVQVLPEAAHFFSGKKELFSGVVALLCLYNWCGHVQPLHCIPMIYMHTASLPPLLTETEEVSLFFLSCFFFPHLLLSLPVEEPSLLLWWV